MLHADSRPQVSFLLALWGKSYIRMFCEISLRSLLAEGNIPAVAKEYQCSFTLLTQPEDIPFFESQPLIPLLKQYCDLRYVNISDVIFARNHSASLTVALERGMKSFGPGMLDTYFIFLVADYLFAGNALSGLLPYMRRGVSAVTAGNYQVVEEEVLESLNAFTDPVTGIIDVPNRELIAWSFRHLHPMTVANTVNQQDICTLHANRLFWRVDDNTMIGRFYLRHMLCIRPEITNYEIGASCDYSFIAEMCPSGEVAHLSDSDEYFVVELQPLLHEGLQLAQGSHTPESLARTLAPWTTKQQRGNAHLPVLFHASALPAGIHPAVQESGDFIVRIEQLFTTPPVEVRRHFYWDSCIQWITAEMACEPAHYELIAPLRRTVWESDVFGPPLAAQGIHIDSFPPMLFDLLNENTRLILDFFDLYLRCFGKMPDVHFWHPHFADYRMLAAALPDRHATRTLFILQPKRREWLEWSDDRRLLRTPLIMYRDVNTLRAELQDIRNCVIHLPLCFDTVTSAIVDVLSRALPRGSTLHIFFKTQYTHNLNFSASRRALHFMHLGRKTGIKFLSLQTYVSPLRYIMDDWLSSSSIRLTEKFQKPLSALWCILQISALHIVYAVHNLVTLFLPRSRKKLSRNACSVLLTFRIGE